MDTLKWHDILGSNDRRRRKTIDPTDDFVIRLKTEKSSIAHSSPVDNETETPQDMFTTYRRMLSYWIAPMKHAQAGFQCIDERNEIYECNQCGLNIKLSELGNMQPIDVHRERSPSCTFLTNVNTPWYLPITSTENTSEENLSTSFQNNLHLDSLHTRDSNGLQQAASPGGRGNSINGLSQIDEMSGQRPKDIDVDSARCIGRNLPTEFVEDHGQVFLFN